ncbi:hypothetical protein BDW59DRAFT_161298 [Aspergillus cavernicola]|uniref:Uncharacterized protein n=1 Tax=Aspergillus cavernicola TaxID=176166 RepID=A0ABR4IDU1_9EURO
MPPASEPAKLAAEVARIIDAAQMPNILWGWVALSLIGDMTEFVYIDFVIPDLKICLATRVLAAAGYPLCKDRSCNELKGNRTPNVLGRYRHHFPPEAYYHLPGSRPTLVSLLRKSDILLWLPKYEVGPPLPTTLT